MKKRYITPVTSVANLNLSATILSASNVVFDDTPGNELDEGDILVKEMQDDNLWDETW